MSPLSVVILGLSITSSWGNGHATNFRRLVRALDARGHDVLFLERDVPWYAAHRNLPQPPYGRTELYSSLADLRRRFAETVAGAHLVVVGSYVPHGVAVGRWVAETAGGVKAFYDIDTPVTLAALEAGTCDYLDADLSPSSTSTSPSPGTHTDGHRAAPRRQAGSGLPLHGRRRGLFPTREGDRRDKGRLHAEPGLTHAEGGGGVGIRR